MDGSILKAIFSNVYAVLIVILFFGMSVFVHEFGHFLSAKLLGLVVDVFSIGFGPALWKRKKGDLELRIGVLPLGGYVVLPQLDPGGMENIQEEDGADKKPPRVLPKIAVWKKIVVSVSGALGNILFAILLAWIVYAMDRQAAGGLEGAVAGVVETNSVAYAEGLRAGDTILSVNGKEVKTWSDFIQLATLDPSVALRVKKADGSTAEMTLPTASDNNPFNVRMVAGVEAGSVCKVGRVMQGSMAEKAGLKPNDVIKSFNGQVVAGQRHLIDMVQEREDQPTELVAERGGERLTLTVTPVLNPEAGRVLMGIEFASSNGTPREQLRQDYTGIFRMLKALVTPKQAGNAAKTISGPMAIFGALYMYASVNFLMLLGFVRFVNVNLAILNLLPIPVLDGGHVLFALYEGIARRPPHPKLVRYLINFFLILLLSLIALLSVRDMKLIGRVRKLWREADDVPAKTAPAQPAPAGKPAE